MNSSGENWYVKLANGDVHQVTVEQLDWAFENGHVDANTLVLCDQAKGWARLGEVAGLDEVAAPAAAPTRPVAPAPTPTPAAAYTLAPRAAPYTPSYAPPAGSLRPVALNLNDLDMNDMPFKSRSRKGWVVAVLSVAVMGGGVGLAATRAQGGTTPVPETAAAQPPPPAETHIPYQTPTPTIATAAGPGDSPLSPRFSEAQKEQLLKADKQHDDKAKAHASSGASSGAPHGSSSTKYKSLGFTTGGNKYDPLNSSL